MLSHDETRELFRYATTEAPVPRSMKLLLVDLLESLGENVATQGDYARLIRRLPF